MVVLFIHIKNAIGCTCYHIFCNHFCVMINNKIIYTIDEHDNYTDSLIFLITLFSKSVHECLIHVKSEIYI